MPSVWVDSLGFLAGEDSWGDRLKQGVHVKHERHVMVLPLSVTCRPDSGSQ